MPDYYAFGARLRSELEFPDLSLCQSPGPPERTVTISDRSPDEPGVMIGAKEVEPGWTLRLFRTSVGLRLAYEATGTYEILDQGRRIVWHRGTDRREEVIRAVILGPVMALALHEAGVLCLHGSAIAVAGSGIGFLAPKGYGKSTLAVALARGGGQLLSDDLVAIDTEGIPRVRPGVHSVRMRSDVRELVTDEFPGAHIRDGWKSTLTNLPPERLCWEPVPLAALYLLEPISAVPGAEARRIPREPMEAVVSIVQHVKVTDDLVGHHESGRMLRWIADLCSRVPVYGLEVPRDLEGLPSVVDRILSWHGSVA